MSSSPEMNASIETDHPVSFTDDSHDPVMLDLSPDRPAYVTTEGVQVWIERKRQKTRFLDAAGTQVGPVHKNFVPAIVWARVQGWRDPSVPDWYNDAAIAEVAAGGAPCAPRPARRIVDVPVAGERL